MDRWEVLDPKECPEHLAPLEREVQLERWVTLDLLDALVPLEHLALLAMRV